ncbi:FRAS1-related extracellular matrix protein 1-like [Ornithodoros turicata]|uniref:FRAS1-related extracellular matrix protein 1-like n=1 Tax=Ornithodoros turicata TaxID=34597 RepID=UPI003138B9F0
MKCFNPRHLSLRISCVDMLRVIIAFLVTRSVCCKDVFVPLGREVFLLPDDIDVSNSGHNCVVEVSKEEPLSNTVGTLTPQTFPCSFTHGQVKYIHYGSLYWKKQTIPLHIFNIRGNVTEVKRSFLNIVVEEGPPSQFLWPHRSLKVKAALGLSDPLDTSMLSLPVQDALDCRIHFSSNSNWPAYGGLVAGSQFKPVESIARRCEDFLNLGIRYKHRRVSSPNTDFIRLKAELRGPGHKQIRSEWVQVLVEIHSGHLNEPPELPAAQTIPLSGGVPTPFTIDGARDRESDKVILNVTRSPTRGDIVCLSFLLPCTSFDDREPVAYLPRTIGADGEPDYAEVVALDNFFRSSRPLRLIFSPPSAGKNASTAAVVRGLFILEGTSKAITDSHLFLPAQANIFLTGGLFHGRIEVGGRMVSYFTTSDVISGRVSYCHDDGDSTVDSAHFLVTQPLDDVDREISLRLPIKILPKDDQAPMLVVNRELAVLEMQQVPLGPHVLSARDPDSPKSQIRYQVTNVPQNGALIRRHTATPGLEPIIQIRGFSEDDIDEGVIIYIHRNNGTFSDSFEVVLEDGSSPPNRSPPAVVLITVVPSSPPPEPDPDSSFLLVTPETESHALTRAHINFIDINSSPADLRYTLRGPPHVLDGTGLSRSPPGWLADPAQPLTPLDSFTQEQVDRRQVIYYAGVDDIGYYQQKVIFDMTLEGRDGRIVPGVVFNVSVLPVNNQPPTFHTGTLMLDEGTTAVITTTELRVHDPDTLPTDLQISVLTVPLHGWLNRNGYTLRVGDLLSPEDIFALRMEYKHDDSENFEDEFTLGINDGVNFASGRLEVQIRPIDDEPPRWLPGLVRKILVEEGSQIVLTSEVLSAVDADTDNEQLHFILTDMPRHGDVTVGGRMATRCTQADVRNGKVMYRTKETEIGAHSQHDSMTWLVSDRALPSAGPHLPRVVEILVLSHNNRAPQAAVRGTLRVTEGGRVRVDVLAAWDEDNDPQDLIFHVSEEPRIGFLENVRPPQPGASGPVTGLGKKVLAFSAKDVLEGLVSYAQSRHIAAEPISDEVTLYVSDGQFNSSQVTLVIEVVGVNDEVPTAEAQNLTLDEGDLVLFTQELIQIHDPDTPPDPIVVTAMARPKHGSLVKLIEGNGEMVEALFTSTSVDEFYGRVGYHHDGSENFHDWFALNVSDGLHTTPLEVFVTVSPINDEPPLVLRNLGAVLPDGKYSVAITEDNLLIEDRDTSANEVVCFITQFPHLGTISGLRNDSVSFTQMDILENKLSYVAENETTNVSDEFFFICSDGVHNTSETTFQITLRPQLFVTSMGAVVQVGKKVLIEPNALYASDVPDPPTTIIFNVTQSPRSGYLELSAAPNTIVTNFTMADVLLRRLSYKHTGEESGSDRFNFVASLPSGSRDEGTFLITVRPAARPDMPPTLHVLLPLRVVSEAPKVLTSKHLYARDVLSPPKNVTFEVLKKPEHGVLLLNGVQLASETFTQDDVNHERLAYQRPSSSVHPSDHFLFRVSNNRVPGFMFRGLRRIKPVKFEILLVNIIGSIPIVTFYKVSRAFRHHPGGQWRLSLNGFVQSQDVGSSANQVLYLVTETPRRGHLSPCDAPPSTSLFSFTQAELENGHVCYMLDNDDATQDGISFKVQNKEGRTVGPYRLDLKWTQVTPTEPEIFLCSYDGSVSVGFRRTGDILESATVSLKVFTPTGERAVKGNLTMKFDAGSTASNWTGTIDSNATNQFVIEATRIEGGILQAPVPVLITLLDPESDLCSNVTDLVPTRNFLEESGLVNTSDCKSSPQTTLRYDEATRRIQQCVRNTWVPWHSKTHMMQVLSINSNSACMKGWQPWHDQCYKWFRKGATWASAKERCQQLDAELVTVLSPSHRDWLAQLSRERPFWIYEDISASLRSLRRLPCPLQKGTHAPLHKHCGQIHGFMCSTRKPHD